MMNRNLPLGAAAILAMVAISLHAPRASAEERATTLEIPAALLAVGVDESRILTQREASSVRGEAIGPISLAQAIAITNPFTGVTTTVIGFGYATPGLTAFGVGRITGDPISFSSSLSSDGLFTVSITP